MSETFLWIFSKNKTKTYHRKIVMIERAVIESGDRRLTGERSVSGELLEDVGLRLSISCLNQVTLEKKGKNGFFPTSMAICISRREAC